MKPAVNSVFTYAGPEVDGCPQHQSHLVVMSNAVEIITIGLPFGHGGTWLGSPSDFANQFKFRGRMK